MPFCATTVYSHGVSTPIMQHYPVLKSVVAVGVHTDSSCRGRCRLSRVEQLMPGLTRAAYCMFF